MNTKTKAILIASLFALAGPGAAAAETPAEEVPAAAQAPSSGYDNGFVLRSADGVNRLRISGLFQPQFAAQDPAEDENAFFLNRARIGLLGNVFSKDLNYLFVAEFSGASPKLMFLSLDYTFVPDWLAVSVGQMKRPFSRPFITQASSMSMIDRPLTVGPDVFGDSSDIGVMLHNGTSNPFEYSVGVFSGAGPNVVPEKAHPLVGMRVGYNTGGLSQYRESDLEGGAPRFGIGAAALLDFDADGDNQSFTSGLVDAMFKSYGTSLTSAIYVGTRQDGSDWSDQRFSGIGHYTQLGHVIAGRFEPVVRYSFLLPEGPAPDRHEVAGGLNVFFHGHALKLQNVVTVGLQPGGGSDTQDVRFQSQLTLAL
ncbi:porin [Vulgatibacter sp.]|uniref:porin n=1 Tax=Vulgatibacter sp. TaxID=1971226 RepID=UPI00356660D7